ncbi:MAG TPA: hypothetical protein VN814_24320 [Caulobacteraceae bacterium]|nr:hypothetical protein [Caulobacteraceae bacterium]
MALSSNIATFLTTVNADGHSGSAGSSQLPASAEASSSAASSAAPSEDPEQAAKLVLNALTSGPLPKPALLERLAQIDPVRGPIAAAELDDVLRFLEQSEMITVDDASQVSLTPFAQQALSVFMVR